MKDIFKFSQPCPAPGGENSSLIVGWDKDAGKLSAAVIEYLNKKIKSSSFCEIEPVDFFSLAGITIEKDIAQFPDGKFYCGQRNDLLIFKGSEPEQQRYIFLNAILDFAQHYCKIKYLYTINGTISSIPHTNSRKILAVFNQQQFQEESQGYGLENMTWKGTPAISSFLLWKKRYTGRQSLGTNTILLVSGRRLSSHKANSVVFVQKI
jgi:hypothetical protein